MSYRYLALAALSFAGCAVLAWAGFVGDAAVGKPAAAKLLTAGMFLGFFGGVYFLIHALPEPSWRKRRFAARFVPSPEVAFEFAAAEGAPVNRSPRKPSARR